MPKKVPKISEGLYWSKNRLASVVGITRETVMRKLEEGGVSPSHNEGGYPVYYVRDALPAIFAKNAEVVTNDPDRMNPKDREAWYRSETLRHQVERESGELIPLEDFIDRVSGVFQTVAAHYDRLPATLERKLGWSATQTSQFESELDQTRRMLSNSVQELTANTENKVQSA